MAKQKSSPKSKLPKVLPYAVAVSMGTKRPLDVCTGEGVCFHHGNRVAITKSTEYAAEITTVTVAEVWSAEREVDIVDGALLTHSFNNFEAVLNHLEACYGMLAERLDNPAKLTFDELKKLAKTNRVIKRARRVDMPVKV